uniref:Patj homolog n=1 Tax=Cacopsylla melanoneura TaxID=428564 RepID=A0A8D9BUA8_9HEMI
MDDEPTEIIIEPEADSTMFIEDLPSGMIVGNGMSPTNDVTDYGGRASSPGPVIDRDYAGPLSELTERAIQDKWRKMLGDEVDIIVAQISKSGEQGGLGISLEGTVDVEDGIEVRPHHYIRSILPEGPVGRNGRLQSGDELLEVNEHRLLGMNHIAVVTILKELPVNVRMVCARSERERSGLINTSQDKAAFAARNILGGSLQNLMPVMERLVKAKSDGSLASSCTTGSQAASSPLSKLKSRSLEPLTGLAMWSSEPQIIELTKGERGLGFSILDYQDPMNPNETVIVIRSLVPGGVAQLDARLIPGDRLLSVNDTDLNNASLDQAVQALKGAPRGVVRIGVAKPLPIPDSSCSQVSTNGASEPLVPYDGVAQGSHFRPQGTNFAPSCGADVIPFMAHSGALNSSNGSYGGFNGSSNGPGEYYNDTEDRTESTESNEGEDKDASDSF